MSRAERIKAKIASGKYPSAQVARMEAVLAELTTEKPSVGATKAAARVLSAAGFTPQDVADSGMLTGNKVTVDEARQFVKTQK